MPSVVTPDWGKRKESTRRGSKEAENFCAQKVYNFIMKFMSSFSFLGYWVARQEENKVRWRVNLLPSSPRRSSWTKAHLLIPTVTDLVITNCFRFFRFPSSSKLPRFDRTWQWKSFLIFQVMIIKNKLNLSRKKVKQEIWFKQSSNVFVTAYIKLHNLESRVKP